MIKNSKNLRHIYYLISTFNDHWQNYLGKKSGYGLTNTEDRRKIPSQKRPATSPSQARSIFVFHWFNNGNKWYPQEKKHLPSFEISLKKATYFSPNLIIYIISIYSLLRHLLDLLLIEVIILYKIGINWTWQKDNRLATNMVFFLEIFSEFTQMKSLNDTELKILGFYIQ